MTPTYNRAYTLPKLYDSLCNQMLKDFEWIVIDDGSTDETQSLVSEWINADNSFEITYKKKKNGGKHRAINDAVKIAKHDWFFIVDSDDFLTLNAVELIHIWLKTVENDEGFCGVAGLKGYSNTDEVVGERPVGEYIDATNIERGKVNLLGDKAEIYRTDILKKFPFPEYDGENFITEAVVWDEIALNGYKLRWFNEIIYKCEYLDDGLTKANNKIFHDNFDGWTHYLKMQLEIKGMHGMQDVISDYYCHATTTKGLSRSHVAQRLNIQDASLSIALIKGRLAKTLRKNKIMHKIAKKVYACLHRI